MILTCPACASRYVVDAASVGPAGRTVRCSQCRSSWHAQPSSDPLELKPAPRDALVAAQVPAAELPGEALPKRYRARVQADSRARKAAVAGAVWGGMAAVLAGVIALSAVFRVEVARLWPRTASAYAAVGLPVNVIGLAVEELETAPAIRDGRQAVIVSGHVRNVSDSAVSPPPLRIDLLDSHGERLVGKSAPLGVKPVPAGETRAFTVALYDPPAGAAQVEAGFAPPKAEKGHHSSEPEADGHALKPAVPAHGGGDDHGHAAPAAPQHAETAHADPHG